MPFVSKGPLYISVCSCTEDHDCMWQWWRSDSVPNGIVMVEPFSQCE